jgi:hypothetical protein
MNVDMLNPGESLLHVPRTKSECLHPSKKLFSHPLEIDIVLPERVIGVNQQGRGWQTIHESPSAPGKSLGTARSLPILSAYRVD